MTNVHTCSNPRLPQVGNAVSPQLASAISRAILAVDLDAQQAVGTIEFSSDLRWHFATCSNPCALASAHVDTTNSYARCFFVAVVHLVNPKNAWHVFFSLYHSTAFLQCAGPSPSLC